MQGTCTAQCYLHPLTHTMCGQDDYELAPTAEAAFKSLAADVAMQCTGNARSVRNLLQRIILQQSSRVAQLPSSTRTTEVLKTIEAADVQSVVVDDRL